MSGATRACANRNLPRQRRVDLTPSNAPTASQIRDAIAQVKASGVVPVLEARLCLRADLRRRLSILGFEVIKALTAMQKNHQMHLADLVRLGNALKPSKLAELGMPDFGVGDQYSRLQKLHTRISDALDEGWEHVDTETGEIIHVNLDWYRHRVMRASIPDGFLPAQVGVAIDGTDMPTWGKLHGLPSNVELDGPAACVVDRDAAASPTDESATDDDAQAATGKVKVLGVGDDGRKIYTKDLDARAGHRSAKSGKPAGSYVGRELHLGVTVPAVTSTDGVTYAKFGPEVPGLIVVAKATPAGSHRGDAVIPLLREAKEAGLCHEVVADAGYSLLADRFLVQLQRLSLPVTFEPKSHQIGERGSISGMRVIDGQLFSEHTPDKYAQLRLPGRGATPEERAASAQQFNERAAFRYRKNQTSDGATQWICPYCKGAVFARNNLRCKRARDVNSKAKLAPLRNGRTACCDGSVVVGAGQLPLMQPTMVGTSAWQASYGRRNRVETANSLLQGGFTTIDKGYIRILNSARIDTLLAYTLAGYNRQVLRQWVKASQVDTPSGSQASSTAPTASRRKPRADRRDRFDRNRPGDPAPPGS